MAGDVRIAVLGAGTFAREAHLPGLKAHPGARVVALFSRSQQQAQRVADAAGGVDLVTDDLPALLARDDIDAVTVASSDDNHYHYTMAALRAGKHVFCEKPLAVHASLAAEMVREARARQRINQVAFIFRYTYCIQELRRRIKAGDIGTPYHISIEWQGYGNVRAQRTATWRDRAESYGAGWVSELGSHFVDTINWAVAPVTEVCGITHTIPRTVQDPSGHEQPHETLDMANVLVRTAGTAQGHVIVSRITPPHATPDFMQVVGEEGALWTSFSRGQDEFLRVSRPGGNWEEVDLPEAAKDGKPHAIFRMLGSYVDALQRGGIDPDQDADFEEGYRVQTALDNIVTSAHSRRFEAVAQGLA